MSTVPDSARGSELGCGSELGVLGLGSPVTSHSAPFLSSFPSSDSQQPGKSNCLPQASSALVKPRDGGCTAAANVVSRSSHTVSESAISDDDVRPGSGPGGSAPVHAAQKRKLHRIAEVRNCQGLSERSFCKRLNIDLHKLRELEDPTRDLSLSELMQVQAALEVPLVDLLEDSDSLARPIQERAKLVRIMKTVAAIEDAQLGTRAKRLVAMLREQLTDLMPELAQVGSWPQFGSRRGATSVARVLEQEISLSQITTSD